MSLKLIKQDVEFLTNTWQGPKGAAYNVVGEDCRKAGLYYGQLSTNARCIVMTPAGVQAVKRYYEGVVNEERNTERKAGNGSTIHPFADV